MTPQCSKRREGGDAGAEDGGGGGGIKGGGDLEGEVFADDHGGRVAAEGIVAAVLVFLGGRLFGGDHGAVVGGEPGVGAFAVVLLAGFAGFAVVAGVDHAADADEVADLVQGDGGAGLRDAADDFVSGHAGVDGVGPLVFDLVDVGVTDAAEEDVDEDLVGFGVFAFELVGFEAGEGVSGGVAEGGDHGAWFSWGVFGACAGWVCVRGACGALPRVRCEV